MIFVSLYIDIRIIKKILRRNFYKRIVVNKIT